MDLGSNINEKANRKRHEHDRRSSILKAAKADDENTIGRSSLGARRVSFADTHQIQEFQRDLSAENENSLENMELVYNCVPKEILGLLANQAGFAPNVAFSNVPGTEPFPLSNPDDHSMEMSLTQTLDNKIQLPHVTSYSCNDMSLTTAMHHPIITRSTFTENHCLADILKPKQTENDYISQLTGRTATIDLSANMSITTDLNNSIKINVDPDSYKKNSNACYITNPPVKQPEQNYIYAELNNQADGFRECCASQLGETKFSEAMSFTKVIDNPIIMNRNNSTLKITPNQSRIESFVYDPPHSSEEMSFTRVIDNTILLNKTAKENYATVPSVPKLLVASESLQNSAWSIMDTASSSTKNISQSEGVKQEACNALINKSNSDGVFVYPVCLQDTGNRSDKLALTAKTLQSKLQSEAFDASKEKHIFDLDQPEFNKLSENNAVCKNDRVGVSEDFVDENYNTEIEQYKTLNMESKPVENCQKLEEQRVKSPVAMCEAEIMSKKNLPAEKCSTLDKIFNFEPLCLDLPKICVPSVEYKHEPAVSKRVPAVCGIFSSKRCKNMRNIKPGRSLISSKDRKISESTTNDALLQELPGNKGSQQVNDIPKTESIPVRVATDEIILKPPIELEKLVASGNENNQVSMPKRTFNHASKLKLFKTVQHKMDNILKERNKGQQEPVTSNKQNTNSVKLTDVRVAESHYDLTVNVEPVVEPAKTPMENNGVSIACDEDIMLISMPQCLEFNSIINHESSNLADEKELLRSSHKLDSEKIILQEPLDRVMGLSLNKSNGEAEHTVHELENIRNEQSLQTNLFPSYLLSNKNEMISNHASQSFVKNISAFAEIPPEPHLPVEMPSKIDLMPCKATASETMTDEQSSINDLGIMMEEKISAASQIVADLNESGCSGFLSCISSTMKIEQISLRTHVEELYKSNNSLEECTRDYIGNDKLVLKYLEKHFQVQLSFAFTLNNHLKYEATVSLIDSLPLNQDIQDCEKVAYIMAERQLEKLKSKEKIYKLNDFIECLMDLENCLVPAKVFLTDYCHVDFNHLGVSLEIKEQHALLKTEMSSLTHRLIFDAVYKVDYKSYLQKKMIPKFIVKTGNISDNLRSSLVDEMSKVRRGPNYIYRISQSIKEHLRTNSLYNKPPPNESLLSWVY